MKSWPRQRYGRLLHRVPGRRRLDIEDRVSSEKLTPQGPGLDRIILFRFHAGFQTCAARIEELLLLNPHLANRFFGMFGGSPEAYRQIPASLRERFHHIYRLEQSPEWCWRYGASLGVRNWYRDFGHGVDFDMLHLIEWDLLIGAPLDHIYAHVPSGSLGLAALLPIAQISAHWYWTTDPQRASEFEALMSHVREKHGFDGPYYACHCPGSCLPRAFLEKFAAREVSDLCHDEIHLPLYAQILGFPLRDAGFHPNWERYCSGFYPLSRFFVKTPFRGRGNRIHNHHIDYRFFNCARDTIPSALIRKELADPRGHRVFHPVREPFSDVLELLRATMATSASATSSLRSERATAAAAPSRERRAREPATGGEDPGIVSEKCAS